MVFVLFVPSYFIFLSCEFLTVFLVFGGFLILPFPCSDWVVTGSYIAFNHFFVASTSSPSSRPKVWFKHNYDKEAEQLTLASGQGKGEEDVFQQKVWSRVEAFRARQKARKGLPEG